MRLNIMPASNRHTLAIAALVLVLAACGSEPAEPQRPALPSAAVQYIQQAQRALKQQAYIQGLALADSIVALAPFASEGHFIRGRLYFALRRYDEAQAAYLKARQFQPDYPGLAHNLGNVAFQQRRYRDAVALYMQEAERRNDPNPWHGLGGTHEALGNAEEAREAYTKALTADPTYAPAHASLADWHDREANLQTALSHAEQAFALDTTNFAYRYKVGALRHRTGDHASALGPLRTVLAAQPWNYQAAFNLGQALQKLGQTEEATALLTQANTLRAEQSDVDRAGRVAKTNPENFQVQLDHADALRRSGRLEEALAAYHIAQSLRPQNLTLQTNIATLLAQMGQYTEAQVRFNRVLRTDSAHADAWLNLGLLYVRTGQNAKANAALQHAFRHGKGNPAVQAFRRRVQQRR